LSDFPVTSQSGQEILGELPPLYDSILEMRIIAQVEGDQVDQLRDDIADQLKQRFVSTATWDLPAWEVELGIVPPTGQPIEQRRAVIRSKMRGIGKFSGQLLKNVAEAYDNGTVDVAFDPSTGTFTVTFVSTWGIPPNLAHTMAAIEEIVPAHLIVDFAFTYLSFGVLKSAGLTVGGLESEALTFGQLERWNPTT
jgi:hypothetical protein